MFSIMAYPAEIGKKLKLNRPCVRCGPLCFVKLSYLVWVAVSDKEIRTCCHGYQGNKVYTPPNLMTAPTPMKQHQKENAVVSFSV